MSALHGYWFCSSCNDTVILPLPYGRWDARRGVLCPVCHHTTADWISTTVTTDQPAPVAPEIAKEFFRKMFEQTKL